MSFSNYQHGGLRAVAFHPDFETNGLFYVSAMESRPTDPENFHYASDWNGGGNFGFSGPIDADSVVVEFKYNLTNNSVIEDSYRLLFRIGMPVYDHPIKYIAFNGSYLFIAHGDGSVQSAITGGGQGSNALGKILRINPLYVNETTPYTIPSDNPYLGDNSFPDEVFAVGFRNPHTFCFSKSGELIVGEAGRDNAEEVNIVEAGHDYGWSQREGFFVHNENGTILKGVSPLPDDDAANNFTYPAAVVGHFGEIGDAFNGQALAGGCPIENGSPLSGTYWYVNFPRGGELYYSYMSELRSAVTMGDISSLTVATTYEATLINAETGETYKTVKALTGGKPETRFGRGGAGELYMTSKHNGKIYRFEETLPISTVEPTLSPSTSEPTSMPLTSNPTQPGETSSPTATPPTIPTPNPTSAAPSYSPMTPTNAPTGSLITSAQPTSVPTKSPSGTPTVATISPTMTPLELAFVATFAQLSIDAIPEGSSSRDVFIAQFQTAVASTDNSLDKIDIAVNSIRAGSVIVDSRVRVKDAETSQAIEQALNSPGNIFTPSNGFDSSVYGVPATTLLTPTEAPTAVNVDQPRAQNDVIYIVSALAAGCVIIGVAIFVYCRLSRREHKPDSTERNAINQVDSAYAVNLNTMGDGNTKGGQRMSVASLPSNVSPPHWDNGDDVKDEERQPLSPPMKSEHVVD
uniref:Glucose/Sorbosone dehydrogenase domain-containing protein n=1 Tax=Lotharella globosa TaxID=91324 RepID=A0A7S4DKX7_9EUKA|mmetsp:Transcript_18219/g.36750  ORF Transcript_18219/g.36750 Transcript_18219/m.36750 type:complete len:690 (-) Transcript_18219:652-2721(-)